MSKKADKFLNPKKHMDDDVEETTRKIAPAMVQPNFGPMPTSTLPMHAGYDGGASSIATAPIKTQASSSGTDHTSIYVWSLPTAPTLPEFHPLEKTAVFVPHISPSTVAARISQLLRDRSIEAHYDNDKAKVRCVTADGVEFRIRLYVGRRQYRHGVIVEVQRRFGSSLVFHSDTQAILNAAEGKTVPPPPTLAPMNVLPEVSDDDDDEVDGSNGNGSSTLPSAESSLAMVAKMLTLPGFDSQYLGLQTLSLLVNPEKLSWSTARGVATNLLRSDSEVGLKLFGYIVSSRSTSQDESAMTLRNMSLSILANALRALCGSNGGGNTTTTPVPEFLREPLRPVLLQDLQAAQAHPNTALLAATCLEYFIQGGGDHNNDALFELNDALEAARDVGEARHANLAAQAKKCLAAIIR